MLDHQSTHFNGPNARPRSEVQDSFEIGLLDRCKIELFVKSYFAQCMLEICVLSE